MRTGTVISGLGHGAVIALVIFGLPWFRADDPEPIRVSEVSFVTDAEFEAAQSAARATPDPEAAPEAPAPVTEAPETLPEPELPQAAPAPEPPAPPPPAPAEVATLEPQFNPDAPLTPAPEGVSIVPPAPSAIVSPPRARPVERIEATPTPPPPENARPADVATLEPSPAPTPEPPVETAPVAAPPEAAPPPPPATPAGQVANAAPPRPRPDALREPPRVAAAVQPQEPVREPEPDRVATPATPATPPTATPPTPSTQSAVAAAVAAAVAEREAAAEGQAAATSLPEGPPITNAERDGLRLAVQRCWNVPAGLRDAQELKVTLAADLNADGSVINGSIRLIEPTNPPDGRFQQAYEAGRRALIRCSPYQLPREKYAQWRNIEVVFNPEGMVSW